MLHGGVAVFEVRHVIVPDLTCLLVLKQRDVDVAEREQVNFQFFDLALRIVQCRNVAL